MNWGLLLMTVFPILRSAWPWPNFKFKLNFYTIFDRSTSTYKLCYLHRKKKQNDNFANIKIVHMRSEQSTKVSENRLPNYCIDIWRKRWRAEWRGWGWGCKVGLIIHYLTFRGALQRIFSMKIPPPIFESCLCLYSIVSVVSQEMLQTHGKLEES